MVLAAGSFRMSVQHPAQPLNREVGRPEDFVGRPIVQAAFGRETTSIQPIRPGGAELGTNVDSALDAITQVGGVLRKPT